MSATFPEKIAVIAMLICACLGLYAKWEWEKLKPNEMQNPNGSKTNDDL